MASYQPESYRAKRGPPQSQTFLRRTSYRREHAVQARDEGAGLLLVSSDLDEILGLSDRILVLYEGRIVAEFARGAVSEQELGLRMGGA